MAATRKVTSVYDDKQAEAVETITALYTKSVEHLANFSPGYCSLLASAAEYLSEDFGLPVPGWGHDPLYTMPELWEPFEGMYPEDAEFRERRG